jgi:probable phosphoglycerate mutase
MRLLLVRHCEADWPEGWTEADPGLTPRGHEQARAVAVELAGRLSEARSAVLSSPARRATETAEVIAAEIGASVEIDDMLWLELLADPDVRRRFAEGAVDEALLAELEATGERVWEWATQLAQEQPDAQIVAVCHDTVVAAVVCRALSMPIAGTRRLRIDMGSLSVIDFRAQRTILMSLNETFHLEAPSLV